MYHPGVSLNTAPPPAPGDCDTGSLSHLQRNISVRAGVGGGGRGPVCRAFLVIKEKVRHGAPSETVFL